VNLLSLRSYKTPHLQIQVLFVNKSRSWFIELTPGAGDGLFARVDIPANTACCFYNGVRVKPGSDSKKTLQCVNCIRRVDHRKGGCINFVNNVNVKLKQQYVYLPICTYTCMYTSMYTCTYVYLYVYLNVYQYVYQYVYLYVYQYTCQCINWRFGIRPFVRYPDSDAVVITTETVWT
jgi:hypothetical protein